MRTAAIYARVSSEKQEEERTVESQIAELRDACGKDGATIVEEYVDDGISGTLLARPALDRLRDDAGNHLFEKLFVLSPDRLARKYAYQVLILEELKSLGVEVIFINRPIGEAPEDQLLLGVEGLIAEYERAKIMERTRRGRLHRAQQGEIVNAMPPYGYDFVPRAKGGRATYRFNEAEAEVVRLIFSLYIDLKSTTKITGELFKRGLRPRGGGRIWHPCTLNNLLRRESYVGRAYYNKTQGNGSRRNRDDWILIPVPRIVDDDTFQMAQKILDEHGGGGKVYEYLLSGLVSCAHCTAPYLGNLGNHRTTPYYRCSNRKRRFPLPRDCFAKLVRSERLEWAVVEAVRKAILQPEFVFRQVREQVKELQKRTEEAQKNHDSLSRKRVLLEMKGQRLLDLYLDGAISKGDYAERNDGIANNLREIDRAVQGLQSVPNQIDEATIRAALEPLRETAQERFDRMSPGEKQQFLRLVIDRVIYDWKRSRAVVRLHVPLDSGADIQALARLAGGLTPAKWDNGVKNDLSFEIVTEVIPAYKEERKSMKAGRS